MLKCTKFKKGVIIAMGLCMCLALTACSKDDSNDNETSAQKEEATKEPINKNAPTKIEISKGNYLDLQFKSLDKVNESDYVAILNKGKANENFELTTGGAVKKVALCEAKSGDDNKFEAGDEIASKENVGENEKVCVCVDVAEGKPNKMIVITCNDDTVKNCLISYNGKDGGAMLVPLNDKK